MYLEKVQCGYCRLILVQSHGKEFHISQHGSMIVFASPELLGTDLDYSVTMPP